MSHRWEDGAAGGSARGAGCCPAERAAARGSRRPQLPLESPTAAERGERSSVCPGSSCIPTVCSSLSAVHLRILPWLPFPRGCLPKRETRHCSHRWHWGCWWPVWSGSFLLPACSEMVQTLASTRMLHVTAAALTSLFYTKNCERRNLTNKCFSSPFCFLSMQDKCPLFFSSCDTVICMKLLLLDLCPKGLQVLLLLGQRSFPSLSLKRTVKGFKEIQEP